MDKQGRLLALGGTPISGGAAKLPTRSTETITTPGEALARTRGPVAPGADTSDDTATKVIFATAEGLRPAWETVDTSSETPATTVIDAVTGQILQRTPLTQYDHSTGRVFKFFPRAHRGGKQVRVDFTKNHWLGKRAHILSGNNSHTYSDVNDNNRPSRSEEVHPRKGHSWSYRLKPFHLNFAKTFCSNPWPCSWNPNKAYSWRANRAQNATQVFFFVNKWHDHLKAAPIGFTEAAGNFQLKNHTKHGKAGDPVTTQTDDGASTGRGRFKGLPDGGHVDNANMATPPDGHRPRMQMYLQHAPFTSYDFGGDPFSPTNVGDEADTVYHEYTHGLSNRLNVDVRGRSTLRGGQSGAMGEAWSDWYAMDYLVRKGLQRDRVNQADIQIFKYDGLGVFLDRTEPIDCKVGQTALLCTGGTTGHEGGYTYADYGNVAGGAEVHSDGEIWAQTLWDLRDALGVEEGRVAGDPGDGARAVQPVVHRHAQRHPGGGHRRLRRCQPRRHLAGLRQPRHGLLGRVSQRPRHRAGRELRPASDRHRSRDHLRHRDRRGHRRPARRHRRDPAVQRMGRREPDGRDRRQRRLRDPGRPAGRLPEADRPGQRLPAGEGGARGRRHERRRLRAALQLGRSRHRLVGHQRHRQGLQQLRVRSRPRHRRQPGRGVEHQLGSGTEHGREQRLFPQAHRRQARRPGRHQRLRRRPVVHLRRRRDVGNRRIHDRGRASTSDPWSPLASGTFTGADNGTLAEVPASGSTSDVRYLRFTIQSNQVPDFDTTCGAGGGPSGCSFTDLSEFQVFGTPPGP